MPDKVWKVDTRFLRDLPETSFPFRYQVFNADTSEVIYDETVRNKGSMILLPFFQRRVERVRVVITWPDGKVDGMTVPWANLVTEEDAPAEPEEKRVYQQGEEADPGHGLLDYPHPHTKSRIPFDSHHHHEQ